MEIYSLYCRTVLSQIGVDIESLWMKPVSIREMHFFATIILILNYSDAVRLTGSFANKSK